MAVRSRRIEEVRSMIDLIEASAASRPPTQARGGWSRPSTSQAPRNTPQPSSPDEPCSPTEGQDTQESAQ